MPRRVLQFGAALVLVVAGSALPNAPSARADQSTVAYDLLRTGWDANEPALTPGSVTASDFGQLWSRTLPRPNGDATTDPNQLYAQPLVADGYVIVATEENQVDALDPKTGRIRCRTSASPRRPSTTRPRNLCTS
jgi:outer membrane protein assembly factor BamB